MVPSSLTKRNTLVRKAVVLLKTWPVTLPSPGMMTVRVCFTTCSSPEASLVTTYKVETPVPLSLTQNGLVGLEASPQALTSNGSCSCATPGRSETRFSCSKCTSARAGVDIKASESSPTGSSERERWLSGAAVGSRIGFIVIFMFILVSVLRFLPWLGTGQHELRPADGFDRPQNFQTRTM